jgi:tetratricopeptide (TPR) repeat protein
MGSLIPGYEYDIFISYRQKDNKGDRWVSKFVDTLRTELEATFKEDVTVYFDDNPHDRLQETHNVDKSLEGKLKCLIFIPILSQTYCDPNSFAWQYEFLSFLSLAAADRYGKDVKLKSGNVASRILPVRIHDLEPEDIKMFEQATGSVLRSMDFVFKTSTGVNRPLKFNEDHPNENLNKTFYNDQINKVANSIKDIIKGLKITDPDQSDLNAKLNDHDKPKRSEDGIHIHEKKLQKGNMHNLILKISLSVIVSFVVVFWFISTIKQRDKINISRDIDGRISVIVNDFNNNTNDSSLNWLKIGIPELLRNKLASSRELVVQNTQIMSELYESIGRTSNAAVIPEISRDAAMKLKAGAYITGSFQKYGSDILTLVKLIDTQSDELLWTGQAEGRLEDINEFADSLSLQLRNFLEIKVLKQKATSEYGDINIKSPIALKKYTEGMEFFLHGKLSQALLSFEESYMIDTNFLFAAFYAQYSSSYNQDFVTSQKWTKIVYRNKNRLPFEYRLWADLWNACNITRNCDSVVYFNNLLAQSDIRSRLFWFDVGYNYFALEQFQNAFNAFKKVEEINSEWRTEWEFVDYYANFGWACHEIGDHQQEENIYNQGLALFPNNFNLLWGKARCALSQQNSKMATETLNKLKTWAENNSISDSDIEIGLANLYEEARLMDEAENHFREGVKLSSASKNSITYLVRFLIFEDRNVSEGLALADSVLQDYPKDYSLLRSKGIGYYKLGRYKEALEILKNYEGLKEGEVWDTDAFMYLKKVKEAIIQSI